MTESKHFHTLLLFLASASCEYTSNVIDMDDILAEDFMPGTLLVLENPTAGFKSFNESIKNLQVMERTPDGSFGNAMETMNFHRSKMNEYLCRNFVAEQIVSDMTTSRIRRRMGHVTPGDEDGIPNKPSQFKPASTKNSLMSDEGSSNYKDWLSKSTTLEDIYRHYDQAQNRIDGDIIEEEEKGEDFDEEYAGYVYPNPHEGHTPAKHRGHTGLGMYYGGGGGGYPYPNAVYHQGGGQGDYHGGGSGYHYSSGGSGGHHGGDHYSSGGGGDYSDHVTGGGGGGGHHHPVVETIYSTPPKYHGEASYGEGNKDHDLSDLFDIALTALAFLSFGLFVVHVIMCISAASQQSTTTTMTSLMMPMSLSPTAPEPGDTGTGNNGGGGMTSDGGGDTATGGGGTGGGMTATATGTGGGGAESTGNSDTGTGGGDIDDGGSASPMGDGDMGDGGGGTDTGGDGGTGSASPGTGAGGDDGADDMPSTGTGGDSMGTATGAGQDTFKFRLRRDIPTITNPNNQALNELARRVLTSIEAAMVANNDGGVCLRKSLCENNKYSRSLQSKDKLFIPMWSLGMSWLAGRLVKNAAPATSMLDTLKASILGLGRANCEVIYQDCDLRMQRNRRRRRRRRRKRHVD